MKVLFNKIIREVTSIFRYLKLVSEVSKLYFVFVLLSGLVAPLQPIVNIIIPKLIIDQLMDDRDIGVIGTYVVLLIFTNLVISLSKKILESKLNHLNYSVENRIKMNIGNKFMMMDYWKSEDPDTYDFKNRAYQPIENQQVLMRLNRGFVLLINGIFTLSALFFIVKELGLFILATITLLMVLSVVIQQNEQKITLKFHEKSVPINRAYMYYMFELQDTTYGKDVRIFQMDSIISRRTSEFNNKAMTLMDSLFRDIGIMYALSEILLIIQLIVIYAYSGYLFLVVGLSVGSFVMIINASTNLVNTLKNIFSVLVELRSMLFYFNSYFNFIDYSSINCNKGLAIIDSIETIEFKNVSFKYPNSEKQVLKGVSFSLNSKQKYAIVGDNGAGKTTIIKLLLGLYKPDSGVILINGIAIEELNMDHYRNQLGVVMQDFQIFATTIKENITLNRLFDNENDRITYLFDQLEMNPLLNKCPNAFETQLYKTFDDRGVELSGGELQKIAILRAYYNDSNFMIFDEPTSSLDPIAEFDIFNDLIHISKDKLTVFISHRMSSCIKCNEIIVLANGVVVESGSHNKLIKSAGEYAKLFNTQARFYNQKLEVN